MTQNVARTGIIGGYWHKEEEGVSVQSVIEIMPGNVSMGGNW